MKIGFLGDVHGSALHALALLAKWTTERACKLDLIVQLGDIGVLPDPAASEPPYDRYIEWNKSIYDLFFLPHAVGSDAEILQQVRSHIGCPILFIRGNHDNQPRYDHLHQTDTELGVAIDPFDLFRYIPDGTRICPNGIEILCSGSLSNLPAHLSDTSPLDVLVTHAGPFGIGRNTIGEIQGDVNILAFVKKWRPRFHIFGHHHHVIGPINAAGTTFLGVNALLGIHRDGSKLPYVLNGCLMVLDSDSLSIEFAEDRWLGLIDGAISYSAVARMT